MQKQVFRVREALTTLGIDFTELSQQDAISVDQKWLAAFANRVKKKHHVFVYGGYRWHGFSYRIQPCMEGSQALEEYLNQGQSSFYIFNEELTFCVLCQSQAYPDLSELHEDLYITHHNMKWTMAFTHEQPYCGPYFALRDTDN